MKRLQLASIAPKTHALVWFSLFAVLYVLLAIVLPPNTATIETYRLSNTEYHILMVLIAIPTIAVWFTAFYGYIKLSQYVHKVAGTAEGEAFRALASGVQWLAWGLPFCANLNSVLGAIAHTYNGFASAALIISHYALLVVALAAFIRIADGARGLADIVGTLPSKPRMRIALLLVILVAVAYTFLTIRAVQTNPDRYRLPMWLILLTIIIPYLYAWLMGLLAAFQISEYRRAAKGLLYRRALSFVAVGTTMAIVAAIVLQYVTTSSGYLRRINFNWSLLLLYIILVVYAAGFILIAVGASRLKRIEEV